MGLSFKSLTSSTILILMSGDPLEFDGVLTRKKKNWFFYIEISSKNRLLVDTKEILTIDNQLRKKSMENR